MPSPLALALAALLSLAWLLGGLVAARVWLRLRDGLAVAALALPLGLTAQVLVGNALAHVVFAPAALAGTAVLAVLLALLLLPRAPALEWTLTPGQRRALLALGLALFAAALALGLRELFGDDGGHASMAHVLAEGLFPPRFHANPELRLSYAYGPNLLAAQVMVVAGWAPWDALDLARAAIVTSVLALAFLCGFKLRGSLGAGLLTAILLLGVGPMVWIYLPLAWGGLASWARQVPALALLVENLQHMTDNPWRYSVVVPGYVTPTYAHAQRALAWSIAPLPVLLSLALLELELDRTRKSLALGLVLGSAALMQPASLFILAPALLACVGLERLAVSRAQATGRLELDLRLVVGPALLLGLFQGGPLTDSLLDRWQGLHNPTTGFHFDPFQWPSCRGREHTLRCGLLSLANLGLMPWLLPWAARDAWRTGRTARVALALGCAGAYAFPFFFRYGYVDWNIQRVLAYASWSAAALVGGWLFERLRAGGRPRLLALVALLLLTHQGLVALGVVLDGAWLRDRVELGFFRIGPLDDALRQQAPKLPRDALIFDPAPCATGTNCRAALLFGRYTSFSSDRLEYERPNEAHRAVLLDPRAETLRRYGYTHFYLDSGWLGGLPPEARAKLAGDALEPLAVSADASGLRALLRVCAPSETCALRLPGWID